jgi:hypothetical protein
MWRDRRVCQNGAIKLVVVVVGYQLSLDISLTTRVYERRAATYWHQIHGSTVFVAQDMTVRHNASSYETGR